MCDYDELMDAAANATFNYSFLEGTEKGDASRLEGFLFPDTYEFYEGMPAATAINKLLEVFHYRITAEMLEWQEESGYTMRQIVTIASMIEKEAANDTEQYTIASVIYNRLNKDWPLQIDSTTLYEYPDHEARRQLKCWPRTVPITPVSARDCLRLRYVTPALRR